MATTTRKREGPRPSLNYEVWAETGQTPAGKPRQQRVALCLHPEDAGCMVSLYSYASPTIRMGSLVLWTEGQDGQAGEGYDYVAQVCCQRLEDLEARAAQAQREYLAQVEHAKGAAERLAAEATAAGDTAVAARFGGMAEVFAAELAAKRQDA